MHLLFLRALQHLDLIVQVLYRSEAALAEHQACTYFTFAFLLHFYIESLLSLETLHASNQIYGKEASRLDGLYGSDQPIAVEVDSATVRSTLVL